MNKGCALGLPRKRKMSNRPQKTNPATLVAEERRQQAFWRNVVSYLLTKYGTVTIAEVAQVSGTLDVYDGRDGLILSIQGQKRSLGTRIRAAWQVLVS